MALPQGILSKEQIPADTKIVDKGTVTVKNENDLKLLYRYIQELAAGNEFYKPFGLAIDQRKVSYDQY